MLSGSYCFVVQTVFSVLCQTTSTAQRGARQREDLSSTLACWQWTIEIPEAKIWFDKAIEVAGFQHEGRDALRSTTLFLSSTR